MCCCLCAKKPYYLCIMSAKRKRSANYTPQETEKLLELVRQHRFAIDDKRTGSAVLARKKEAWEIVCEAYNAVATSGTRTVDQLRVLYDNKKQRARKVLATHNKNRYSNIQTSITVEEVKEAILHVNGDEGQCSKPPGGSWHTVTDLDYKILNLIGDQVAPLQNSSDSSAVFYGEHNNSSDIHDNHDIVEPKVIIDTSNDSDSGQHKESNDHTSSSEHQDNNIVEPKVIIDTFNDSEAGPNKEINDRPHKNKNSARLLKKKVQIDYKTLYFKRKCQNALLERRFLYQNIRLKQKEHYMVLKEHQLKMQLLKEEHEKKTRETE